MCIEPCSYAATVVKCVPLWPLSLPHMGRGVKAVFRCGPFPYNVGRGVKVLRCVEQGCAAVGLVCMVLFKPVCVVLLEYCMQLLYMLGYCSVILIENIFSEVIFIIFDHK